MNADMANFIGIHMLNEIIEPLPGDAEENQIQTQVPPANYTDPETGAHFEYNDILRRIRLLAKRRAVIDRAIEEGEA
jgi:hypothetical protein